MVYWYQKLIKIYAAITVYILSKKQKCPVRKRRTGRGHFLWSDREKAI